MRIEKATAYDIDLLISLRLDFLKEEFPDLTIEKAKNTR